MDKEELKETIWNGFKSWQIDSGVETEMVYVPKQSLFDLIDQLDEPEKSVIPQFVAGWIKDNYSEHKRANCKEFVIWDTFKALFNFPSHMDDRLIDFLNNRADLFVRAVTDGYTVEEKKYRVLDKKGCVLVKKYKNGTSLIMSTGVKPERFPDWQQNDLLLTEQEIKEYDERFWPFAVKVEGLSVGSLKANKEGAEG